MPGLPATALRRAAPANPSTAPHASAVTECISAQSLWTHHYDAILRR